MPHQSKTVLIHLLESFGDAVGVGISVFLFNATGSVDNTVCESRGVEDGPTSSRVGVDEAVLNDLPVLHPYDFTSCCKYEMLLFDFKRYRSSEYDVGRCAPQLVPCFGIERSIVGKADEEFVTYDLWHGSSTPMMIGFFHKTDPFSISIEVVSDNYSITKLGINTLTVEMRGV